MKKEALYSIYGNMSQICTQYSGVMASSVSKSVVLLLGLHEASVRYAVLTPEFFSFFFYSRVL